MKLYTAEWHGDSRGYKLDDPWPIGTSRCAARSGITNIHVHKGPTIRPLDRDAFDVADIDHVATDFTDLNFVVEHVGLPRLEDFCWIATQEPNVYAGLAVAMPFIHTRPRYFAQIMGELMYWIGEDQILFSSDYALWTPKWLIEKFVDFQIPEDMTEYAPLTTEQKKKMLGLNAAELYDLDGARRAAAARRRRAGDRPRERGADLARLMTAILTSDATLEAEVGRRWAPSWTPSSTSRSPTSASSARWRSTATGRRRCTCGCRRRSAHRTSPS